MAGLTPSPRETAASIALVCWPQATSADLEELAAMIAADYKKASDDLTAAADTSTPPFPPVARSMQGWGFKD